MAIVILCPSKHEAHIFVDTQIQGLIVLGTSMDMESERSRQLGCWDPVPLLTPFYDGWSTKEPTPDWAVEDLQGR